MAGKQGLCFLLGLLFMFLNCGGTAPRIVELRWRLNIQFTPRQSDALKDSNTLGSETLSLFIRPADEDGMKDLDSMYLINNEADLFWALDASQWKTTTSANIFWIGSNQFSSGYMKELPRGNYLVELYDKAGEMARHSFELRALDTRSLSALVTVPPIGDELLFLLPKDISLYSIVGYNVANDMLFADANYQSIISLKELKIHNDELEKVQIAFEFPNTNVMALLGPYMAPRIGSKRENLGETDFKQIARQEDAEQGQNSNEGSSIPDAPIDTYIPTREEIEAANNEATP